MKKILAKQKVKDAVKQQIAAGKTSLTVGGVMAAAGLSRTSFYANYENLEQVLVELENEFVETYYALSCEAMGSPAKGGRKLAEHFCGNRHLLQFWLAPNRGSFFLEKCKRITPKLARRMMQAYSIRETTLDLDLVHIILQGSLQIILQYALENNPEKILNVAVSGSRLLQAVRQMDTLRIAGT